MSILSTVGDVFGIIVRVIVVLVGAWAFLILPIKEAIKKDKKTSETFGEVTHGDLKIALIFPAAMVILFALFFVYNVAKSNAEQRYYETIHNAVESSTCFSYVFYDENENILTVEFRDSGQMYDYYNFSQKEFDSFIASGDLGRYYNNYIKGQYPSMRVD